jgi:hypothetical protein
LNNISGVDVDGQTSNVISSNWEVTDPDSNIDFCEWSIGKSYYKYTLLMKKNHMESSVNKIDLQTEHIIPYH